MNQTPTLLFLATLCSLSLAQPSPANDAEAVEFFERKIRPVLVKHCYECHSSESKNVKGGLLLDSRDAMLQGGDSGEALIPGKPDESLILEAIRYEGYEMPPAQQLPAHVIADFEKWIKLGATDPRNGATTVQRSEIDIAKAKEFWSFQPPKKADLTESAANSHSRIDQLIHAKLNENGLRQNPRADKRTLLRRLTFDLTGLPPQPEQIEAFIGTDDPQAYSRAVDRLLASPQYGEHWTRLWLDIARYAEDQAHIVGSNSSLFYPNAYRYRDWVIDAFNRDIPYDRFVTLQLAADLVEPESEEHQPALGFIGLGPKYYRRGDLEVMADEWEDRVDTVTRGLMGLTVACARCHDHKFDPIPTEDYYSLAGVFASTEMYNRPLDAKPGTNPNPTKKPDQALHIIRDGKGKDLPVFVRGDVNNKGKLAPRRFLQVLSDSTPLPFIHGSGRAELAHRIVDPQNPLTARVIVNRFWGAVFGEPLVVTPSNFGSLGETPTHPRLLDDLAVRFVENGWSMKWLLREMVLSETYQASSAIDANKQAVDPANKLLWRMNRRRLNVEQWRDTILAVTGSLSPKLGGKSMDPSNADEFRRTVYSRISRLDLNPMLALFDHPDPNVHSARRAETTTPLQKLFVLNSPFMVAHAKRLADQVSGDRDVSVDVKNIYRAVYGRQPSNAELEITEQFLSGAPDKSQAWIDLSQALLASNELLVLD